MGAENHAEHIAETGELIYNKNIYVIYVQEQNKDDAVGAAERFTIERNDLICMEKA